MHQQLQYFSESRTLVVLPLLSALSPLSPGLHTVCPEFQGINITSNIYLCRTIVICIIALYYFDYLKIRRQTTSLKQWRILVFMERLTRFPLYWFQNEYVSLFSFLREQNHSGCDKCSLYYRKYNLFPFTLKGVVFGGWQLVGGRDFPCLERSFNQGGQGSSMKYYIFPPTKPLPPYP